MSDDPHADAVFNLHRKRQGFSDAEIIAKTTSANLHSIIRERDATIAELERKLDDISMEIEDACLKWIFEQSGPILAAKDATITELREALDYALTAQQTMANLNDDETMDEIIHDCANVLGNALAASAPRKVRE